MQKAFGITALVLSIIAIFIPILGPHMTVLVAILAIFSAGPGFSFGLAAIIINIVNLLLLSPQTWLALDEFSGIKPVIFALVWIVSQIIALFFLIRENMKYKVKSQEPITEQN